MRDSWPRIRSPGYVGVPVGVVGVGDAHGPLLRLRVVPANEVLSERRRRDSNPRYPVERYNTLAGCRLQPLGHSSGARVYQRRAATSTRLGRRLSALVLDLLRGLFVDDVGLLIGWLGFEDLLS